MWSNEIVFRLFMEITLEKLDVGLTARKPIKERGFLLALLGALYLAQHNAIFLHLHLGCEIYKMINTEIQIQMTKII